MTGLRMLSNGATGYLYVKILFSQAILLILRLIFTWNISNYYWFV